MGQAGEPESLNKRRWGSSGWLLADNGLYRHQRSCKGRIPNPGRGIKSLNGYTRQRAPMGAR